MDVVIGYVEPHARPETTAQIGELEIVPPHRHAVPGRGAARDGHARPSSPARRRSRWWTNSRTPTRPAAKPRSVSRTWRICSPPGINVISTLNIQHLESLYNLVEGATGVRVKERIPDEFLTRADQIVNIDLPAEDLIERLQAGKIYPPDRVAQALSNFFTPQNLTRLREMALSESANFLDRRQRAEEMLRPGAHARAASGRWRWR